MKRAPFGLALAALLSLPTTVFAQATATHWSAVYTGPIFVGAALVAMGIGALFAAPGWNRLGVMLWLLLVTAAGCLAIYTMQGTAQGAQWQLPAFSAGLLVFVAAGNWALVRLKRASR
jgi:hypothetical protein